MIKLHHKITAGCLVCFFLLWAVRIPLVVRAASSLPGIYVQESIGTIFSDSALQSNLENVLLSESNIGASGNQFDVFSLMDDCTFTIDTSKMVFCSFNSGGGYLIQSIDVPENVDFIYYAGGNSPRTGYFIALNDNSSQDVDGRTPITGYGRTSSGTESQILDVMVAFYPWGSGQQGLLASDACLLYSPIPVYSQAEAVSLGAPTSTSGSNNLYLWMLNNHDQLTDVRGSGAVFNGSEIIDPSEPDVIPETIDNHVYAENFDIGFCMDRLLINSPANISSLGGGYIYIKCDVDDFAKIHVGDLELQIQYELTFDSNTVEVNYTGPIPNNGFIVYPVSQVFNQDPDWMFDRGLVIAIDDQSFYGEYNHEKVYAFTNSQWQDFTYIYNNVSYSQGDADAQFVTNLINDYTPLYLDYDPFNGGKVLTSVGDIFSHNLSVSVLDYQQANLRIKARIVSDNIESGLFQKVIDFKTGREVVGNNGISINPNPYDGTSYDIIPSGYGSITSGGSMASIGNVLQNVSFPDNIKITDGSYEKVAQLYHAEAASVQSGFWAMLGYYADNPMVDTYGEVFGLFPEEFLTYIEACLGICFGFAVFRTLRRR